MNPYTEDTLVQQTTADCLRDQLGWESVYAFDAEDFGPDSLLGRASQREVVLTRTLRAKLAQFNPGLPDAAYDEAIRQMTATAASQSILATNREKYDLMRDGVKVSFRNHQFLGVNRAIDAVRLAIQDYLWSDDTGLPVDHYAEAEVQDRADEVYRHVYRVYPTLPSPFYEARAGA